MKKIELILKQIKDHEFSREIGFEDGLLKCDCSGFITFLLKKLSYFPNDLNDQPKAEDYFDYAKVMKNNTLVQNLNAYDCLVWKKENIPAKGDSGHILIVKELPKEISKNLFLLKVIDVTKESGLCEREVDLHCHDDGNIWGIRWSSHLKKVKKTQILAFSPFSRKICSLCALPKERCLCSFLPHPKVSAPPITILRHPKEKDHPFATWHLLNLFFADLDTREGIKFSPQSGTLVYPDHPEISLGDTVPLEHSQGPFLFIDATWKKSKRIIYENPWLSQLPRISINNSAPSQYTIRHQPRENYISTLEAIYHLWSQLEKKEKEQKQLLDLFLKFNKDQRLYSPSI